MNTPFDPTARELFDEMSRWPIFDPHSHIDPHRPRRATSTRCWATTTIPNSPTRRGCPPTGSPPSSTPRAGAQPGRVPRPDRQHGPVFLAARDRPDVSRLPPRPDHAARTSASSRPRPTGSRRRRPGTARSGQRAELEAVFLTNDFDDPLEGWDTRDVRPLPADRRPGLEAARAADGRAAHGPRSGVDVQDYASLRAGDRQAVRAVRRQGARGLRHQPAARLRPAPRDARAGGDADPPGDLHRMDLRPDEHDEIRRAVFWMLAEFCAEFRLPFDLMIGPIRNVYPAGVAGGRDLFDRRVSLYDYRELFNHFAGVTFPVSTLSPDAGGRAGGLLLDLPQRACRWATGGTRTCRRSSPPTCGRGSRPCPRSSWSAITPTRTSWSSSCPSSTCTAGSWRRTWPRTRSVAGAGRSSGRWSWHGSILLDNPRRIFGGRVAPVRRPDLTGAGISRHACDTTTRCGPSGFAVRTGAGQIGREPPRRLDRDLRPATRGAIRQGISRHVNTLDRH